MIRLTKDEIKAIESVLNRRLTSKYDWFKGISINKIYYKPGDSSYFTIVGEIKVDETWGYKQWKEYYYDTPFNDENLSFADIIGGDLSQDIQKEFKSIFSVVSGEKIPKYMSFDWILVKLVDGSESDEINLVKESKDNRYKHLEKMYDEVFNNLEMVKTESGIPNNKIDYQQYDWLDSNGKKAFERNHWGRFWIYDCELYKFLMTRTIYYLGFPKRDFETILINYLNNKYGKRFYGKLLKDIGNENCGKVENVFESELTERCWPGYTQKGMKTMFGKRYPNCVKNKKRKSLKETILKEDTEGIDIFMNQIQLVYNLSDELNDFVTDFITKSDCKKIEFANFKFHALGLALHDGVLINSMALKGPIQQLLFVIFHEIAHQYQFKKYGEDIMYNCYIGNIDDMEAAKFLKKTEETADNFASRKIRELIKMNLIPPYTPPQVYKNIPIQQILMMIQKFRYEMRNSNVDSPEKVSEYFYNMVKSNM